jgi:hypothetical protein
VHLYCAVGGDSHVLPPVRVVLVFADVSYGISIQCGLYEERLCLNLHISRGAGEGAAVEFFPDLRPTLFLPSRSQSVSVLSGTIFLIKAPKIVRFLGIDAEPTKYTYLKSSCGYCETSGGIEAESCIGFAKWTIVYRTMHYCMSRFNDPKRLKTALGNVVACYIIV